jgi:non-heme chloroperoxidase
MKGQNNRPFKHEGEYMKHHLLQTILLFLAFITSSSVLAQSTNDAQQRSSMTTTVDPIVIKSAKLSTGVTLPYVEQGNPAGIPVILLHGATDSWRSFEPVLPHLPESLHVFALTQRGHGDADKPASGYAFKDFSSDVAAFMDHLGLESAVIAGSSMGSSVAQHFALDYPERTLGLVLMGAFVDFASNQAVVDFYKAAIVPLTDPIDPAFAQEWQQSTLAKPIPPALLQTFVNESLKVPAGLWRDMFAGFLQDDLSNELSKITAPTLLMWGDQDDFAPRSNQETLLAKIPNARLEVYVGGGHAIHWEDPERVAADITAFISSQINQEKTVLQQNFSKVQLATGVTLNYVEHGNANGEAVLLLHGYPDSWHSFSRVLPLLSDHYHVFALDQRGHGDSSKDACCYTMDDFAADVVAFMDAKSIDQATLVGHSMGSVISQLVAIQHPERVKRLVLIGSTNNAGNPVMLDFNTLAQTLTDPIDPTFVREFQIGTLYSEVPDEFVDKVVAESLKAPAKLWREAWASLIKQNTTDKLATIRAPTLIVWGDHDVLFSRAEQDILQQRIPNARLHIYEETGHGLHWEKPERFVSDFEQFMQATE